MRSYHHDRYDPAARYRRGQSGTPPKERNPSAFRINGVLCFGAGGQYDGQNQCARGRRVFAEMDDERFRSEALEGPFPVRPKTFQSAETLCANARFLRTSGVIFGPKAWHGAPQWYGGQGKPSPLQMHFVETVCSKCGLNIEWLENDPAKATKGHFMDLITLLYLLIAPLKITGNDQILACAKLIGKDALFLEQIIGRGGNWTAYPFAKAICHENDVLLNFDFQPIDHPDRFVRIDRQDFLGRMQSEVRKIILPNGLPITPLRWT